MTSRLDSAVIAVEKLQRRMDDYLSKRKYTDPIKLEIELASWDNVRGLVEFLKYLKSAANMGHSFEVGADLDADGPGRKKFGKEMVGAILFIDGDGADKISRIWLNGTEVK